MARKTLEALFVHSLSDIYSAEKQRTKALGKLARAATNEQLSQAFETHAPDKKLSEFAEKVGNPEAKKG